MKRPLLLQELAHVLIRLSDHAATFSQKRVRRRTCLAHGMRTELDTRLKWLSNVLRCHRLQDNERTEHACEAVLHTLAVS